MLLKNYACLVLLTALSAGSSEAEWEYLSPHYRPDPSVDGLLSKVVPGHDAFPLEKPAEEIERRMGEFGEALRSGIGGKGIRGLLAPEFSGTALRPQRERAMTEGPELSVYRSDAFPSASLDAAAMENDWAAL